MCTIGRVRVRACVRACVYVVSKRFLSWCVYLELLPKVKVLERDLELDVHFGPLVLTIPPAAPPTEKLLEHVEGVAAPTSLPLLVTLEALFACLVIYPAMASLNPTMSLRTNCTLGHPYSSSHRRLSLSDNTS